MSPKSATQHLAHQAFSSLLPRAPTCIARQPSTTSHAFIPPPLHVPGLIARIRIPLNTIANERAARPTLATRSSTAAAGRPHIALRTQHPPTPQPPVPPPSHAFLPLISYGLSPTHPPPPTPAASPHPHPLPAHPCAPQRPPRSLISHRILPIPHSHHLSSPSPLLFLSPRPTMTSTLAHPHHPAALTPPQPSDHPRSSPLTIPSLPYPTPLPRSIIPIHPLERTSHRVISLSLSPFPFNLHSPHRVQQHTISPYPPISSTLAYIPQFTLAHSSLIAVSTLISRLSMRDSCRSSSIRRGRLIIDLVVQRDDAVGRDTCVKQPQSSRELAQLKGHAFEGGRAFPGRRSVTATAAGEARQPARIEAAHR